MFSKSILTRSWEMRDQNKKMKKYTLLLLAVMKKQQRCEIISKIKTNNTEKKHKTISKQENEARGLSPSDKRRRMEIDSSMRRILLTLEMD